MTEQMDGQVCLFDQDGWSGKTCQEHSAATKERTLRRCSPKRSGSSTQMPLMCLCLQRDGQKPDAFTMSWEEAPLHGALQMPNTGVWLKDENESVWYATLTECKQQKYSLTLNIGEKPREENRVLLSEAMEQDADEKYRLSERACQGILTRAARRGKALPQILKMALEQQIAILSKSGGAVKAEEVDIGFYQSIEEQAPTFLARQYKDPPVVVYDARGNGDGKTVPTIIGDHENRVTDYTALAIDRIVRFIVRRLTPLECERLQGFPDGWTDIGDWVDSKGKTHKASDSHRYKALGNSIAVGYANSQSGFWCWMMKRISGTYERTATMGSLFDGIGGFPLAWEAVNGKGSARWASEIEEFPIAVTKLRFPDEEYANVAKV